MVDRALKIKYLSVCLLIIIIIIIARLTERYIYIYQWLLTYWSPSSSLSLYDLRGWLGVKTQLSIYVCLSVCLPACQPACLPVCLSVCLSVCRLLQLYINVDRVIRSMLQFANERRTQTYGVMNHAKMCVSYEFVVFTTIFLLPARLRYLLPKRPIGNSGRRWLVLYGNIMMVVVPSWHDLMSGAQQTFVPVMKGFVFVFHSAFNYASGAFLDLRSYLEIHCCMLIMQWYLFHVDRFCERVRVGLKKQNPPRSMKKVRQM